MGVLTARQGPAAGGPLCLGPSDLPPWSVGTGGKNVAGQRSLSRCCKYADVTLGPQPPLRPGPLQALWMRPGQPRAEDAAPRHQQEGRDPARSPGLGMGRWDRNSGGKKGVSRKQVCTSTQRSPPHKAELCLEGAIAVAVSRR